jgi:hypothetical protein
MLSAAGRAKLAAFESGVSVCAGADGAERDREIVPAEKPTAAAITIPSAMCEPVI